MIAEPLFYAAAIPAVTLMGLAKGGFAGLGLLSLPILALTVSPVQAAAIMLPILLVQDVVTVWAYRRSWSARAIALVTPGVLLGLAIGFLLAARVSDAAVKLAVGGISVAFGARRLWLEARAATPAATRPGFGVASLWGVVCGFTSMIAHAGGPPFQIYLLPQRLPREVFVGTGAVFFAAVNWIKVPPYILLGQFTPENLGTSAALFPVALASTLAGVWLVRRVPVERLYAIIYGLLVAVGLKLAFDGLTALV